LHGHTGADMALLDSETGVLFAADLVFNGRAPTTPHAQVDAWLKSLDQLEQTPFKILVPGHGDVVTDAAPIRQTRAWLQWLTKRMHDAANAGLDMTELLALPLPDEFHDIAVVKAEYPRSVGHLYPAAEAQAFRGKKP
ncbi:MAG TPA: MBL fold metallo-hydrolase, partial [Rhodocyclaceae bacterium]